MKERKVSVSPPALKVKTGMPQKPTGGPLYAFCANTFEAGGFLTSYEIYAAGLLGVIHSLSCIEQARTLTVNVEVCEPVII